MPIVLEAISSTERDTPEYLSVDYDKMKGTFCQRTQTRRGSIPSCNGT